MCGRAEHRGRLDVPCVAVQHHSTQFLGVSLPVYSLGGKQIPVSLMDLPLTDFIRSIEIVQPVRLLGFFLRRQMFWLESQCTDRLHI